MEFVAPHKFIKNTSTNGTVPTELLLNGSNRLWTPKRIKERGKKKRGIKKKTSNPGGKLQVRRNTHIKKDSLMEGKSAGTEKELWGIKGECSRRSAEGQAK